MRRGLTVRIKMSSETAWTGRMIVDIFRLAGVSGTQKVSKLVKTVQSGLGE